MRREGGASERVWARHKTQAVLRLLRGEDMAATLTGAEGNAPIFFAIDPCSLKLVGIHAAKRGTRFEALEPIRQGLGHSFGASGQNVARGLTLRNDHSSQFIAEDIQQEIAVLGIKDSTSYVCEPQGNGIAERFLRIYKENLLRVGSFRTVEELRLALFAFKEIYNRQWRIGRLGYRSPAQVQEKQKAEVARAASASGRNCPRNPRPLHCQRAHAHLHPSGIYRRFCCWFRQREKCNSHGKKFQGATKELRGSELLGARLLRFNRRSG